jgi:hypothetical protein
MAKVGGPATGILGDNLYVPCEERKQLTRVAKALDNLRLANQKCHAFLSVPGDIEEMRAMLLKVRQEILSLAAALRHRPDIQKGELRLEILDKIRMILVLEVIKQDKTFTSQIPEKEHEIENADIAKLKEDLNKLVTLLKDHPKAEDTKEAKQ